MEKREDEEEGLQFGPLWCIVKPRCTPRLNSIRTPLQMSPLPRIAGDKMFNVSVDIEVEKC